MSDFSRIRAEVRERISGLGIREIVYFHCDHFEPWQNAAASSQEAAAIVDFAEAVERVDFARRLTLFYLNGPRVRFSDDPTLVRAAAGDPLGFVPRDAAEHEARGSGMRHLRGHSGHEIQVHIHHEGFTHTLRPVGVSPPPPQLAKTRIFDGARLDRAIDLWFEAARREFDYAPTRWFFVHGLWSLNASDPEGCNIEDEIARLLAKGCLGDFTFPAGRPHCDPHFEAPYFCAPAFGPKAYDGDGAAAEFAWGNSDAAAHKFFVWNSPIKAPSASLDWGDIHVRRKLAEPEPLAREIVDRSFRWDGVLFIKTHAHSLHRMNRDDEGRHIHPHCYGPTRDLYAAIFDGAAAAGAAVTFATASEVYDRFVAADRPATVPPMSSFLPPMLGDGFCGVPPTRGLVREVADRIDGLATAALATRIAELGAGASGAEAHYAALAARGSVVPRHDVRAAAILASRFPTQPPVDEIGAGIGALPLLLSALGFSARGIESSNRRYEACLAVDAHVGVHWDGALAPHDFMLGRFPECVADENLSDRIAVITDFTCTMSPDGRRALIHGLRRYRAVLLELDHFIDRISSDTERRALIDQFRAAGISRIYDVDVSPDFAFVLIVNDDRPMAAQAQMRAAGPPPAGDDARTFAMLSAAQRRVAAAVEEEHRARLANIDFDNGDLFADGDLATVELARAERGRVRRVWEIGCGIGQAAALLAADGFDVVAVERDPKRFAALRETVAALERADPASAGRIRPVAGLFPDIAAGEDVSEDLAVAVGITWDMTADARQAFVAGLHRFKASIIDFGTLFAPTNDSNEATARAETYLTAGGGRIRTAAQFRLWHKEGWGCIHLIEQAKSETSKMPTIERLEFAMRPPFTPRRGAAWTAELPAECLVEPVERRATMTLFEGDRPLGPANAMDAEICADGMGRYAIWPTEICFSTSDGSDPNVNGRPYRLLLEHAAQPASVPPDPAPPTAIRQDEAVDRVVAFPLSRHLVTADPRNAECRWLLQQMKRRVLVVAPSRSGSEYLASLLREAGIDCREYFNERSTVSEGRSITAGQQPAEFIAGLCRKLANGMFCAKESIQSLVPLFEVGEFPDNLGRWHFIELNRRNAVRQAVSLLLAEETGWWRADLRPAQSLRLETLTFDGVSRRIDEIHNARSAAQRFFAAFEIAPLELWYEDLVAAPDATIDRIAAFIGLPLPKIAGELDPDRPRVQSSILNERIEAAYRREWQRRLAGEPPDHTPLLDERTLSDAMAAEDIAPRQETPALSVAVEAPPQVVRDDSRDCVHARGHREFVGGLWDEIGNLQFAFLREQGLRPSDVLVDIACGALRGGVHFIRYLDRGHYLGIDKWFELIAYGIALELGVDDFRAKRPQFVVDDDFAFDKFDARPTFGIAQSLFSHLKPDDIVRCLTKLRRQAAATCQLFATFVEAVEPRLNPPLSDSHAVFRYTHDEMARFAADAGWTFDNIGEWGHPRGQRVARMTPRVL